MHNKALLLSGGLDSTAIAAWQKPDVTITIDYGQKPANAELRASQAISKQLGIEHHIISIDCSSLGSGDMAGSKALDIAPVPEWWPYRNQLLITLAASKAVSLGMQELMIGCLRTDDCHTDGTQEFIDTISRLTKLQEGNLNITAPAIKFSALELIKEAKVGMELLGWSHSCHVSDYACGVCRGCVKHYQVMEGFLGKGNGY